MVEGRVAVAQLLRSPYPVRSLLVDDHQVTAAADLVSAARALGAPVYVGSRSVVAATVGFSLHRGVVAVADRIPAPDPARLLAQAARGASTGGGRPIVAVSEGLNDHENIGALFRNAAAFGVGAVLLDSTCADPLYRRSVRVSAGHVLHVPFARLTPWPEALAQVRAAGFVVVALAPRLPAGAQRAPVPLDLLAAPGPGVDMPETARSSAALSTEVVTGPGAPRTRTQRGVAVVVGAEGPGLSPAAVDAADVVATIPMAAGVDSLNVATAAAIAFHRLSGG